MAKIKYFMIRVNNLYAVSGICKNQYSYNNCLADNIVTYFLTNNHIMGYEHIPIFLQEDASSKNLYIEIITKRSFFIKKCPVLEDRFQAVDRSCCSKQVTFVNDKYGVDDVKSIMSYFEKLKKEGKYEMYIEKVDEIFRYIDMCKEDALNGIGKVEDSVDASDYLNGINHDANLILSAKNGKKRKK